MGRNLINTWSFLPLFIQPVLAFTWGRHPPRWGNQVWGWSWKLSQHFHPREQVGLVEAAESGLDFRRLLLASGEGKEVSCRNKKKIGTKMKKKTGGGAGSGFPPTASRAGLGGGKTFLPVGERAWRLLQACNLLLCFGVASDFFTIFYL